MRMQYKKFTTGLMQWHQQDNTRHMPWKGETDPYKVWLSEIILQQTRVEQGWAYYEKFVGRFPTIQQLAAAKDEAVFKMWEGLGYYTRCNNLLATARHITNDLNGQFPDTYEAIVALKGVGPYTAAAIASFCFNLPHAVLDGNVFRVLSRCFGIDTPADSTAGKQVFGALAAKVLDQQQPGQFNQAIMDFGATVCTPRLPRCSTCPLHSTCVAHNTGMVAQLPVKEKLLHKKQRWFTYFIFRSKGRLLLHQRTAKDIWHKLFEFYLVETDGNPQWDTAAINIFLASTLGIAQFSVQHVQAAQQQQLTHRQIKGYFITVDLPAIPPVLRKQQFIWAPLASLGDYAFPVFINQYLKTTSRQATLL